MKRALILLHGNKANTSHILNWYSSETSLICADGGTEYAKKYDLLPDLVVGDMDSISLKTLRWLRKHKVKLVKYPRKKNSTDSEIAIEKAQAMGCTELIVFGLLGDRIDHMSANILYLSTVAEKVVLHIIEGNQTISFIRSVIKITGKEGDEVSLIPLRKDCKGITTKGLTYGLQNATLPYGSTRGISNVMESDRAEISIEDGVLMVVHRNQSYRELDTVFFERRHPEGPTT